MSRGFGFYFATVHPTWGGWQPLCPPPKLLHAHSLALQAHASIKMNFAILSWLTRSIVAAVVVSALWLSHATHGAQENAARAPRDRLATLKPVLRTASNTPVALPTPPQPR